MSEQNRQIRVSFVRIAQQRGGTAMWIVADERGQQYQVQTDRVSASNRAFWAWTSTLIKVAS